MKLKKTFLESKIQFFLKVCIIYDMIDRRYKYDDIMLFMVYIDFFFKIMERKVQKNFL